MKCEACGHDNVEGARFCASCGVVLAAPKDSSDPMIGQVIGGRFRIVRVLGEGGMGVVYEAEQQMGTTVRKVAVKTLHKQLSTDPSVAARFHRECGTVAQLEHPNTVKVYDFGATADGTLYIAMEYLQGEPLNVVIEKNAPLPPERVGRIVQQIAGSLDEAHGQGVIHRDLKPENVVLIDRAGEKDVVKLLDFGIAARTESADAAKEQKLTQQGMVLGTPPYMSPEQFTGKALDKRSDIYSLGVMTYEMVTGKLPFEAATPWQWATEHMTSRPRPFELSPVKDKIPAQMQSAILRALEKDKEKRQPSARAFYLELMQGPHTQAATNVVVNTGSYGASAASAVAEQHTAAMDAVPDFSAGGVQRTVDMPAAASRTAATTPGAVVATTLPGPAKKGNKGLVLGLGGLAAVLLIGTVVVAMQSKKSEPEVALTNPFEAGGSAAKATIAPTMDSAELAAQNAPPTPADNPATDTSKTAPPKPATNPGDSKKPPSGTTPSTPGTAKPPTTPASGGAASTPSPGTPPKETPTTPTTPPKEPAASGTDACLACVNAARSGNIPGAARSYSACSIAALKERCRQTVQQSGATAAQKAAAGGNCKQAAAIAAAATAMGAMTPKLSDVVSKCK
ncbi:MAG TPA: protein kinase [Polyangiaceae bacterium]|nr:protein kinase [Polyangiaceae bacterium]